MLSELYRDRNIFSAERDAVFIYGFNAGDYKLGVVFFIDYLLQGSFGQTLELFIRAVFGYLERALLSRGSLHFAALFNSNAAHKKSVGSRPARRAGDKRAELFAFFDLVVGIIVIAFRIDYADIIHHKGNFVF